MSSSLHVGEAPSGPAFPAARPLNSRSLWTPAGVRVGQPCMKAGWLEPSRRLHVMQHPCAYPSILLSCCIAGQAKHECRECHDCCSDACTGCTGFPRFRRYVTHLLRPTHQQALRFSGEFRETRATRAATPIYKGCGLCCALWRLEERAHRVRHRGCSVHFVEIPGNPCNPCSASHEFRHGRCGILRTVGYMSSDPQPAEVFEHWCESCGRTEMLTPGQAFDMGWDFPPRIGEFGVVTPRTCPRCPMSSTVWWAVAVEGRPLNISDRNKHLQNSTYYNLI